MVNKAHNANQTSPKIYPKHRRNETSQMQFIKPKSSLLTNDLDAPDDGAVAVEEEDNTQD